jgi:hypothetical protein
MSVMHSKIEQPYAYLRHELVEPDWTRLPGWRHITAADWASAQWQRVNCIKSIKAQTLSGTRPSGPRCRCS